MSLRLSIVIAIVFTAVSAEYVRDPVESFGVCVRECDRMCGDMGLQVPGIEKLTSCQAKCEFCRDDCLKHEEMGGDLFSCGYWCAPKSDKMLRDPSILKAKCLASSVPEHHSRYS